MRAHLHIQYTFHAVYIIFLVILLVIASLQMSELVEIPWSAFLLADILLASIALFVTLANVCFLSEFSATCDKFYHQQKLVEDLQYVIYHIRLSLVRADIRRETLSALYKIYPEHRFFVQSRPPCDVLDNIDAYLLRTFPIDDDQKLSLFVIETTNYSLPIPSVWLRTVCDQVKQAFDHAQLLEHAIEVADLKSEFLSMMSHEIRTPLTGVINMLDLLDSTVMTVEQSEYVETAQISGKLLLAIINDILDYSKIEANKLVLDDSAFDVGETFRSVELISMANSATKSVAIRFNVDLSPIENHIIYGDCLRVRQVLLNLVNNAVKFTPRGMVTVTATFTDPQYDKTLGFVASRMDIEVKDTGVGIPPEYIKQLFQPFTQARRTGHTPSINGTGLGLAICHRLLRMMKGTIVLKSELGEGTLALVNLPLRAKPVYDETAAVTPNNIAEEPKLRFASCPIQSKILAPNEAKPFRVLFAEDNVINQKTIVKILSKIGYTDVTVVDNGAAALDAYSSSGPFDVILLDNVMPIMNGDEVCSKIRNIDKHQVIICVSANALANDHRHFWDVGMNDIISKPIDIRELRSKLDHWREEVGKRSDCSIKN